MDQKAFSIFYILSDSTMLRATHSKNGKITEAAKKVGRAIFFLDMPWHRQPSFENVPSDSKTPVLPCKRKILALSDVEKLLDSFVARQ